MKTIAGFVAVITCGLLSVVGFVLLATVMKPEAALFIVATSGPVILMWCFYLIHKKDYDDNIS